MLYWWDWRRGGGRNLLEEGDDAGEVGGLGGGDGFAFGDFFNTELERALEMQGGGNGQRGRDAGDDRGVGRQGQLQAEDGNGAALREGQADLAHSPGEREQRDIVVVAVEEGGAGEGQCTGAAAVDDGVDLLGGGGVGDGHHVIADLADAHGAAFGRDVVDGFGRHRIRARWRARRARC